MLTEAKKLFSSVTGMQAGKGMPDVDEIEKLKNLFEEFKDGSNKVLLLLRGYIKLKPNCSFKELADTMINANKVKKLDIITNESLEDCMNDMTLNYIKYNDFFESITKVSDKNPNSILSNNNMIATKQNILQNQN